MTNYDYAVYIGRFQPFHNAHLHVIKEALKLADKIIVLFGSVDTPRDVKNPLTYIERKAIMHQSLLDEGIDVDRFYFCGIRDNLYQDSQWVMDVYKTVENITNVTPNPNVTLVGHEKDKSSFYVKNFKDWDFHDVGEYEVESDIPLSATTLRNFLFSGQNMWIQHGVPKKVYDYLQSFTKTKEFENLKSEYEFGVKYEKQFETVPYSVNFFTADAVITQSNHVLLVKRKSAPGKGLLALPGGHVDSTETSLDASIREAKEEAKLNFAPNTFKSALSSYEIFDHPDRSLRGRITSKKCRTTTIAYHFKLDDTKPLPNVSGGSDAAKAFWVRFDQIDNLRSEMFEDHADIINHFIFNN